MAVALKKSKLFQSSFLFQSWGQVCGYCSKINGAASAGNVKGRSMKIIFQNKLSISDALEGHSQWEVHNTTCGSKRKERIKLNKVQ
jgi:hypothetical protein